MDVDYSQTYLYKLHKLALSIDKVFDQALRQHANIGLSQFTLLLAVAQHGVATQRAIVDFLDLTPAAISRQVEVARTKGWITVAGTPGDRRAQVLTITPAGTQVVHASMEALEQHVFRIFEHSDAHTHLMGHIDLLLGNIKNLGISVKGESMDNTTIPLAADLFQQNGGDLNRAVIDVQKATGKPIDDVWWRKNIGAANNDLATARRFDAAYAEYVRKKGE